MWSFPQYPINDTGQPYSLRMPTRKLAYQWAFLEIGDHRKQQQGFKQLFIHSFNKYLLNVFSGPGTGPGPVLGGVGTQ